MDFWTKDDLNKNWSLYEEESMDTSEAEKTTSSQNSSNTFSGKSSPTRDTWDPMLYNINLTSWVELNIDEDVQIRKQPVLETPITPSLPGMEDLSMFLAVSLEQSRSRQASMSRDSQDGSQTKNYFLHSHMDTCSSFLTEKNALAGSLPQKVK